MASSSARPLSNNDATELTAAEILRLRGDRKEKSKPSAATMNNELARNRDILHDGDHLDEEIRRLEAELRAEDDNDDSSSSSESSSISGADNLNSKEISTGEMEEPEPPVLSLSSVNDARIEPLSTACLPFGRKRVLKGIDAAESGDRRNEPKKQKVNDGVKYAVQEILDGYVARSSEKLPFYCRVCSKQFDNLVGFLEHKRTEFHKTAADMERKASYCKLCRKQLTSPVQLKEHLHSRPHKERLDRVRSNEDLSKRRGKEQRGNDNGHDR